MVVAATGFFDGVHKGHRKVLSLLCELAHKEGKKSAVISFWPHPRSVLQQQAYNLRLLNSLEEKKDLIKGVGVNKFITIPFNKEFSNLSTEQFLCMLRDKYKVSTLIIGYDHRFGHDYVSQQEMILIAGKIGIKIARVEEFILDESIISSTKIRKLLQIGDVAGANEFLGYRYGLKGVVVSGQKVGRTIGFPTANMELYDPLKIIPADGVYSVFAQVLNKIYIGICNIGTRPTIAENNERTIETHILNFNEDIYGLDLKIEFINKIREEQKFSSLELLKNQLCKDKTYAYNLLRDKIAKRLR
ncbi:MAG: bifunctional riboflavin kinase/FAD synthetase [Bacteroidales bacterium]